MPKVTITLAIEKAQILKYYKGVASTVSATALNGKTIQFPASILRPFVEADGVYGQFIIEYDTTGKFSHISRVNK